MPLTIIRNDITKIECDAIVNAANSSLLGGGGVDGAIHKAAGKGLLLECAKLGGCKIGQAKITKGHKLPAKYIIHTVGPVWCDGNHGEDELLSQCYLNSLHMAAEHECETVAFPLISSGAYGYPKDRALKVAINSISDFLLQNDMNVMLVVYDKDSFHVSEKLISDITEYIDDKYIQAHFCQRQSTVLTTEMLPDCTCAPHEPNEPDAQELFSIKPSYPAAVQSCESLSDKLKTLDESFSQMLLRKIDESEMTDSQCYKRANIDRKLFSKIRSDIHYKPSKTTAIAFALALEMNLDETKDFLSKAGFALSHSSKFDIIIEYFIENKNYNVLEINEVLFEFDQNLIGA